MAFTYLLMYFGLWMSGRPAPLLKRLSFLQRGVLSRLSKSVLCAWGSVSRLYVGPSTSLSAHTPVPCCLDSRRYVMKSGCVCLPMLFLFSRVILAPPGSLHFPVNHRISLPDHTEKPDGSLPGVHQIYGSVCQELTSS